MFKRLIPLYFHYKGCDPPFRNIFNVILQSVFIDYLLFITTTLLVIDLSYALTPYSRSHIRYIHNRYIHNAHTNASELDAQ